jgi:hypothetical protein
MTKRKAKETFVDDFEVHEVSITIGKGGQLLDGRYLVEKSKKSNNKTYFLQPTNITCNSISVIGIPIMTVQEMEKEVLNKLYFNYKI